MTVRVLLFAALREAAGAREIAVEAPDGVSVAELRDRVGAACPALAPLLRNVAVAVNEVYAESDTRVAAGDTVALIPPVSGG